MPLSDYGPHPNQPLGTIGYLAKKERENAEKECERRFRLDVVSMIASLHAKVDGLVNESNYLKNELNTLKTRQQTQSSLMFPASPSAHSVTIDLGEPGTLSRAAIKKLYLKNRLRRLCEENGLELYGTKDDLIDRLVEANHVFGSLEPLVKAMIGSSPKMLTIKGLSQKGKTRKGRTPVKALVLP